MMEIGDGYICSTLCGHPRHEVSKLYSCGEGAKECPSFRDCSPCEDLKERFPADVFENAKRVGFLNTKNSVLRIEVDGV